MRGAYRGMTTLLSATMIALGVAILVRSRGGTVGILLGVLFIGAGAGRLYLLRRRAG